MALQWASSPSFDIKKCANRTRVREFYCNMVEKEDDYETYTSTVHGIDLVITPDAVISWFGLSSRLDFLNFWIFSVPITLAITPSTTPP
ncbi:hypothetical protein U1Q18_031012 [Sarracenia purpurea var. burkii]